MSRVLVLGAGMVAKPLVEELLAPRVPGVEPVPLTLAALNVGRARALIGGHPQARAVELDVEDGARLADLVAEAEAVVSLLPAPLHPRVAEACLAAAVPLVTTSYVSEAMRALDGEARQRGVLLLNECGLDPGIDHLLAVDGIRRLEAAGHRVVSLASTCGGIPAPESNDNPWGYKLSWSPRAVLVAARSPVRWLAGGEVVESPSPFVGAGPRSVEVAGLGRLEAFPNRDSLPYREIYGLGEVRDLFRGTLRWPGWCETFRALRELDLLDSTPGTLPGTWAELMDSRLPDGTGALEARLAAHLGLSPEHPVIERLRWAGLTAEAPLPELPPERCSPLDAVAALLAGRLGYRSGERDLVVLSHEAVGEAEDGSRRRLRSRLVRTGEAGDDSAMAQTVGIPAALACRLVLGGLALSGVRVPVERPLVEPLLAGLARRGLTVEEDEEDLAAPGS